MRMWNVDPKKMCREHLLGEHLEMHMFLSTIRVGKSLEGYLKKHLVEVRNICARHDELVEEMLSRGWKHTTPIPEEVEKGMMSMPTWNCGEVDAEANEKELIRRCERCRERQQQ